jgi:hypothetical protein
MPAASLPPFESVLKSREVEDPVNLWVHRPLAYAFVALVYRTTITPNQITVLAIVVGFLAAACFFVGTPFAMVLGGGLLWTSAILDGADGILARAKRMFTDFGRALDGASDMLVAIATVGCAFWHVWVQGQSWFDVALMPLAFGMSMVHVYSYDYYKEAYLQHTNPSWDGVAERVEDIQVRLDRLRAEKAPWYATVALQLHVDLLGAQQKVVSLTNPGALRAHLHYPVSDESVRIYRANNAKPMQLWAAISLAPHSYGMAICAMFDRLDVYLYLRVFLANALFLIALVWQRHATRRTNEALATAGLAAKPFAPIAPVAPAAI